MKNFDIHSLVEKTLAPLDVPFFFNNKGESSLPIVLYNITDERGYDYWDDEEQVTRYRVMINIFSNGNYIKLKNQIQELMVNAGFSRLEIPACEYQEDLGIYNQPMIFEFYI